MHGSQPMEQSRVKKPTKNEGPINQLVIQLKNIVERQYLKKVLKYSIKALHSDMKPLQTVEGTGFLHMAQSLINFGARYGFQLAEAHIQHRTTLKNNYVPEICKDDQQTLKTFFQSAPPNHKFAYSKDIWTDKYKQRSFLSMTSHLIDNNWNCTRIRWVLRR